jgi:glycosyltransferase involved in cell wall biosynthesis
MPHITVTIPAYNRAHLIGRTIESVLRQAFDDFDLLVVDDASQDGTPDIVQAYCERDPRVRLHVNPANLGLTRNWNRCLDLAQGPLVQVLLSDDLMDPAYLALVSQVFDQHPALGFVAASCRYIDAEDHVTDPGQPIPARLYPPGDEAVAALLTGGFPHVSSIVMRRECYQAAGKFDEQIWHGPDVEMDARLAARYGFYHAGQVCTSFRRHGTNMGNLEYLREDFLEADVHKKRLAWSYLSPAGRARLGVHDLEAHLARGMSGAALLGVSIAVAYGRPWLARRYWRTALARDRSAWRRPQFLKATALLLVPKLGQAVMQRRLKVKAADEQRVRSVELSLHAQRRTA